jgi:hypothetical protein
MTDVPENDPAKRLTDQIKAHPGLAIAGALAVGVLASALLPKGSARKQRRGGSRCVWQRSRPRHGAARPRNGAPCGG